MKLPVLNDPSPLAGDAPARTTSVVVIQVFDPPMCCPTGVCGPEVDPELVRVAADLDWLARQGVAVARFNLTQQPAAFVSTPVVKESLQKEGNACLPLVLANGAVVSKGKYPGRDALAALAGLEIEESLFTDAVAELVAIGAAIGSNCETCFKYHYNEARKLGVSKNDMRLAVEMARRVKEAPARSILELADKLLSEKKPAASSCCGPGDGSKGQGSCC